MPRESLGLESQLLPGFISGFNLNLSLSLSLSLHCYHETLLCDIIKSGCNVNHLLPVLVRMESVYCQEHKTLDEGMVHHVTVVHMGGELERSGRWLVFLCVVCECVVRVCVGVVCVMCVCVVCVWCVCGVCGVCVCM